MIFKDKATADLNNWLFVNLPLYCIIATIVIVYLIKTSLRFFFSFFFSFSRLLQLYGE